MSRSRRLTIVLGLNLALVAALVSVGFSAHSLAVLAAGADYVADAGAIGVSLLAMRRATARANAFAALVNAAGLLVLSALVIAGSVDRLVAGSHSVHGLPVLVVGSIAAVVMFVGALILMGDADDDTDEAMSLRAVLLDTLGDATAAAGAAVTGAIILATGGFDWLDPTVALVVALVVSYHGLGLLRRVVASLRRPADGGPNPD